MDATTLKRRGLFLGRMIKSQLKGQDKNCPYCNESDSLLLGKKYSVLQLRRCQKCQLMFRWPKDTPEFNEVFYQNTYSQDGLTTDLPVPSEVEKLLSQNFSASEKNFSQQIAVLKKIIPSGKVLDYGSSWGYITVQLKNVGYDVTGYELSKPRAAFGEKNLKVKILTGKQELEKEAQNSCFDVIFASHVLEHLPTKTLHDVFNLFASLLKPKGTLFILVPNCGGAQARKLGVKWGPITSEKHTLAYDRAFFEKNLPAHGFQCSFFSDPYNPEKIAAAIDSGKDETIPDGDELMVIARLERPRT